MVLKYIKSHNYSVTKDEFGDLKQEETRLMIAGCIKYGSFENKNSVIVLLENLLPLKDPLPAIAIIE